MWWSVLPVGSVDRAEQLTNEQYPKLSRAQTITSRVFVCISVQVTNELMSNAADDAIFMHCLPRHKEEVADEVRAGNQQESRSAGLTSRLIYWF